MDRREEARDGEVGSTVAQDGKRRRVDDGDDCHTHTEGDTASVPLEADQTHHHQHQHQHIEGSAARAAVGAENESSVSGVSDDSDDEEEASPGETMQLVQSWMEQGADPRDILMQLGFDADLLQELNYSPEKLWKLVYNMVMQMRAGIMPPPREPITSIDEVVRLINTSHKVLILTGAGVSTSCGIPDFRSENGIYARLKTDYPTLPDPQSMFDMKYFKRDQKPFFDFAAEIWPGNFQPAPSHRFIRQVEAHDKLLRNYTQNIDTLEQVAGIQRVIQCHGSFSTASCLVCKHQVPSSDIEADVKAKRVPMCPKAGTACCPLPPPEKAPTDPTSFLAPSLPLVDPHHAGPHAASEPMLAPAVGPGEGLTNAPTGVPEPSNGNGVTPTLPPAAPTLHHPDAAGQGNVAANANASVGELSASHRLTPTDTNMGASTTAPVVDSAAAVALASTRNEGQGDASADGPTDSGPGAHLPPWLRQFVAEQQAPPLRPVMKPDIVFFGQDLPETFYRDLPVDCQECDLVIVIGSSLKVSPVARIPDMIPTEVPQILINREPLPHLRFNAELLGNCDEILEELSIRLGWTISPRTQATIDPTTAIPTVEPGPLPTDQAPASNQGPTTNHGAGTTGAAAAGGGHAPTETTEATVATPTPAGTSVDMSTSASTPQLVTAPNGSASTAKDTHCHDGQDGEGAPRPKAQATEETAPEPSPEARTGYLHGHHFLAPNRFAFPGAVLTYVHSDDESDDDEEGMEHDAAGGVAHASDAVVEHTAPAGAVGAASESAGGGPTANGSIVAEDESMVR
eukprot:m.47534 g.47534  ORF g.47534 m.47534 type:complete len:798 (+) comp6895_c0_seq1:3-2396(+)